MPNYLENFGLEFLTEDDDTSMSFMGYLVQNGKAIEGYYGLPTLTNRLGDIDMNVRTSRNEEGNLEVDGLDTHCSGNCVWELVNTGMNIQPKDSSQTEKLLMLKCKDGSGMVPIHVLNADVIPSFLEDDIIKLQMTALPIAIHYYLDEDAYADAQPENDMGKKWLVANGSIFPAHFLSNHSAEKPSEEQDYSTDDIVLFTATVKKLYHGTFALNGNEDNTFIRCIVDTDHGPLELDHTIDQLDEESRNNLRIGAIVSGACILSGDAAIYEYDQGVIKDFEHDFRLIRNMFVNGEPERLRKVLSETAEYVSDSSGKTYSGADEIIARLEYVHNSNDKCYAHAATITSLDSDELEYDIGTRCIVIAYNEESNYEAIAFIDVDTSGMINRIKVSTDSRYHFAIDQKPQYKPPLDDAKFPDSVVEPILARAMFHGFLHDMPSPEELFSGMAERKMFEQNIQRMLDSPEKGHTADAEEEMRNLFGYLFAKSIEYTVNENREHPNMSLVASYSPHDAFSGDLHSTFGPAEHEKLMKLMVLGKQFYKDYYNYEQAIDADDEQLYDGLVNALLAVQQIGHLYAPNF